MPEYEAERQRDHHRQPHRHPAQLQVLPDQRQVVAAADRRSALVLARGEDEADRVAEIAQGGEGLYHRAAARVQGVRTFWMPSTMRSSTTASSTHSPPATTTLERNWVSAKTAPPSPPAPPRNTGAVSPPVLVPAIRSPAMISG